MKRRIFPVTALALTLAAGLSTTSAFAQTKWDLAAAYPATNFHTENMVQLARRCGQGHRRQAQDHGACQRRAVQSP